MVWAIVKIPGQMSPLDALSKLARGEYTKITVCKFKPKVTSGGKHGRSK